MAKQKSSMENFSEKAMDREKDILNFKREK